MGRDRPETESRPAPERVELLIVLRAELRAILRAQERRRRPRRRRRLPERLDLPAAAAMVGACLACSVLELVERAPL